MKVLSRVCTQVLVTGDCGLREKAYSLDLTNRNFLALDGIRILGVH